jgi:hypothetical protein
MAFQRSERDYYGWQLELYWDKRKHHCLSPDIILSVLLVIYFSRNFSGCPL